ncbi:glycerate kinase [Mobilisporobacter senegalensis]|uniref:Glycerate kinase n=1 Tax=Mobilisporobacter senegalensis TaxID=1329262 RepID=A0A3N1XEN9_9FIRM|nr:glycerate kinase [Mobilisporobacter senegalensis]ROR23432.1 glycerate kinase [Mobilisporobacter senegalensis]
MKVVVAIDSLKGSLSSMEAGNAIKEAILKVTDANVIVKPLADGGEGTVDALTAGMGGTFQKVNVKGPLGDTIECTYGILQQSRTAIIEMAGAAGITLVHPEKRNPLVASTYGVGEVILDAIKQGCRKFIVGIGGSATNDGGIGMLEALGVEFFAGSKQLHNVSAKDLEILDSINIDHLNPLLKECTFQIACDVINPLCGANGASYVFGPQKGADSGMVERLDKGLDHYSQVTENIIKKDFKNHPGSGAAGGLGFAFLAFLNGQLQPGIDIILNAIQIEEEIADADFVITGEGKLDFQTAMGKAPIGVAKLAKKHGKKVIAFAGGVTKEAYKCNEVGIDAYFSIMQMPMTLEKAMETTVAKDNIKNTVEQVFRLILTMEERI